MQKLCRNGYAHSLGTERNTVAFRTVDGHPACRLPVFPAAVTAGCAHPPLAVFCTVVAQASMVT